MYVTLGLTLSRDTPGSKSLERPLAVASELMSEAPPRALDAMSEDNVTISSPDPNVEPQEEKVRHTPFFQQAEADDPARGI